MRATARRTSTTVVAVVGDPETTHACVERLGYAANVVGLVVSPDDHPLDRAVAAWKDAARAHAPYFVHDADPLAAVAEAWVRLYDEHGPRGELEVAVSETLARWRPGSIELPDYYLVLDAETWGPTRRHWYLGVLHAAAPARVVPVAAGDAESTLPRLGAGRWWPDLDELLDGIDRVVPDRVGVGAGPGAGSG
jgi:hypothetical protein